MATVKQVLHTGRQDVQCNPGDVLELVINTGPHGAEPSKVSISNSASVNFTANVTEDGAILAGSQLGPSVTIFEQWNGNATTNTIKQKIGANTVIVFNVTVDPQAPGGGFGFPVDLTIGRG